MYRQLEYLRKAATMTVGAQYKVDLPTSGLLSFLWLKLSGACVSGATLTGELWRLQDWITDIEIVANGSTIIKKAQFKHFDFLNWLYTGVSPLHSWRNYATNTQFEYVPIFFGRHMWDLDYGLDLSKYDSVELRVTNNSSATYHSAMDITTLMGLIRENPAGGFAGEIRTEEWREWTTVADEIKYLELPTELPICGIYLRALPDQSSDVAEDHFGNVMLDIDFRLGGGTKQVFRGDLSTLAMLNHYERGSELMASGHFDRTADKGVDVSIGRLLGWAGISGAKDGAGSSTVPTIEADNTYHVLKAETREADSPIHFLVRGYGYQCMGWLLDNHKLDPNLMLDLRAQGDAILNIQTKNAAASADGIAQVVLERLYQ